MSRNPINIRVSFDENVMIDILAYERISQYYDDKEGCWVQRDPEYMTVHHGDVCGIFETAKLLKEKGFDAECDYLYVDGQLVRAQGGACNWNSGETLFTDYKNECSAPTLQMAMKWLKTKGLYITTQYFRLDVGSDWATVTVYRMNKYGAEIGFEGYDVEELYDKAIKFCCENLI